MAPPIRPLTTGEVLDTAFGLYRARFFPLLVVALACRAVPLILGVYLQQLGGTSPLALFDHWELALVQLVLSLLLGAMAVAATTFIVSAAYLGHPVTPNAALGKALTLIGPLTLAALFRGMAVAVGLIALLVPGVVLWSGLALATAIVALEQPIPAMAAINRSWTLTSGFRMKVFISIFVAILLFSVPAAVVSVVGRIGEPAGVWSPLASGVLNALLQLFAAPFMYVVITVLYYDLRVRKEGFDLELLSNALQRTD